MSCTISRISLRTCGYSYFNSKLENGKDISLSVKISNQCHVLLPNVYNISFGPLNARGRSMIRLSSPIRIIPKSFPLFYFFAYAYLKNNPDHYLGIDGSDNARAYFYYRALQRNFNFLDKYFRMFGVKYYVRITRFGKTQYDNPFDFEDIMPYPFRIRKETRWARTICTTTSSLTWNKRAEIHSNWKNPYFWINST